MGVPREQDRPLPVGVVTFLLTDVVGSARLWERDPDKARRALTAHRRAIDELVARRRGARPEEQGEGDSTLSAFGRASDACAAALEIQELLRTHADTADLVIRAALHTGEAQLMDERNYLALAVNRCARLRALAHPGQILLSRRTRDDARAGLDATVELRDLGVHRLKDLAQPEHVFQLSRAETSPQFPPLSSLDTFTNNLPLQLTSFVGRDEEVRELRRVVAVNRLVTLTGAGGCGKTRLSLQVAADLVTEFPDGVWFVGLAGVNDPDRLPAEVANALFLQPGSLQTSRDTLQAYLKERALLIVLDNCEHLVGACADLAELLLRECPGVSLLTTSREPLRVSGEAVWRVPSLSVSPLTEPVRVEELLTQYSASRLFIERAAHARRDLAFEGVQAQAVAEICRRLDGIPLAVELAAARVRVLLPTEILTALDQSFGVLGRGARTALHRHQTLHASIDWSYSLLSTPEQLLLDRLAVFRGFTLEAVQKVCAFGALLPDDMLDLVSGLVDKSLVQVEVEESESRYRLLETVRQFAEHRLVERGDLETVLSRHRETFLDVLRTSGSELEEGDVQRLNQVARDWDNLRCAVESALKQDPAQVLRCALPLVIVSRATARGEETRSWLTDAISAVGDEAVELRASALYAVAVIAAFRIDVLAVLPVAVESQSLFGNLGNERGLGRSSVLTGFARTCLGDADVGLAEIQNGLDTARRLGDSFSLRLALLAKGYCVMHQDMERGRESLDAYMELHSSQRFAELALVMAFQSWCDLHQGRWRAALVTATRAGELAREHHHRQALAIALVNQGEALLSIGALEQVARLVAEAERICLETQDVAAYAILLSLRCRLALANGDLDGACNAGRTAVTLLAGTAPQFTCFLQLALARAELEQGGEAATQTLVEASNTAESYRLSWPLATAAYLRARACLLEGRPSAAHVTAADALTRYERIGSISGVIECLELMAEIANRLERYHHAVRLLSAARTQRELTEFVLYPVHRSARQALLSQLAARLGDEFDAEWEVGRGFDLRSAAAFARAGVLKVA